jgi:hypothetical protein
MNTGGNGLAGRHLREDDERASDRPDVLGSEHSGRWFVVAAVFGILTIWGSLQVLFQNWRARYRERTAFGRRELPHVVDGLARIKPPELSVDEWRRMVSDTHAMLEMLVGANLLDHAGTVALRNDLNERVAQTRPNTALDDMIRIWSDMDAKAGPALLRAPRPSWLELAIVVDSLNRFQPITVSRADWTGALTQTRRMLIALDRSGRLDPERREALHERWSSMIQRARNRPIEARDVLEQVWIDVEAKPMLVTNPRPDVLRDSAAPVP